MPGVVDDVYSSSFSTSYSAVYYFNYVIFYWLTLYYLHTVLNKKVSVVNTL